MVSILWECNTRASCIFFQIGYTQHIFDINFKEIFPNSYVIKFDTYGNRFQKELLEILKKM